VYTLDDFHAEALEAAEKVWFVRSIQAVDRTDLTVSLRLSIRQDLFVHVLLGQLTGSLYFALIERGQRIFGIDRHAGEWHMHPYDAPHEHVPFPDGLEPKPLLSFLSKVEDLLIQHDLL